MEDNDKFRDLIERYQILTQPDGWRAQRSQSPLYCPADGSVGDGWVPILEDLFQDLIEMGWDRVLLQVKEKFGTARLTIGTGTLEMRERVDEFEDSSATICELCGEPGTTMRDLRWHRTLCRNHHAEAIAKEKQRDSEFTHLD